MFESEDTYWWFVGRRALAVTLLEQHLQEGAKLLDVGCGTGAGLKEFAKRYDTFGVDMSPLALEFSSGRGIPNLFLGDGQKLPVAQESFDGVISLDTIEHIPDDRAAFAEIYRLMKPGATFVVNVPAYRWLWGPHDEALMHQRRYTRRELVSKLHEAGFKVTWCSYQVLTLFPFVVASRLVDRILRRGPSAKLPPVSPGVNRLLTKLQEREGHFSIQIPLPWGSSVAAVAQKPG